MPEETSMETEQKTDVIEEIPAAEPSDGDLEAPVELEPLRDMWEIWTLLSFFPLKRFFHLERESGPPVTKFVFEGKEAQAVLDRYRYTKEPIMVDIRDLKGAQEIFKNIVRERNEALRGEDNA
jgi:hypothetical protein